MLTGAPGVAPVTSTPLIVTLATPASAPTVITPLTVAWLASSTLLSAGVREASVSSMAINGGASV